MKRFFKWLSITILCLLGVAVIALVLCKTVFRDSLVRWYNEMQFEERVELLRATRYEASDNEIEFAFRPDSVAAAETRAFFGLDSIAESEAYTWDKALAVAEIVSANIPHENQAVEPTDKTARGLWKYRQETGSGFNCKYHSVLLHEMLNAVGITNRIVWCMPMDSTDRDCHVVNHVWLPELEKWAMIDTDMNTYLTDAEGLPMSLPEIRADIAGENLSRENMIVPANGGMNFYKAYLAKNLYWFETLADTGFNIYDRPMRYVRLLPVGFGGFGFADLNSTSTTDDAKFWAAPE